MLPHPPPSPLFPYTTLFRSRHDFSFPSSFPRKREAVFRSPIKAFGDEIRTTHLNWPLNFLSAAISFCLMSSLNAFLDRKSTRLNSSHPSISYAVFCLKKKKG